MAKDSIEKNEKDDLKEELSAGLWILIMLAVLTGGEFLVASIALPWGNLLLLVALWKSYYVVTSYMHIGRLFGGDEEAH